MRSAVIGKGGSGIQDGISDDVVPWSLIERCSHTELALAIRQSSLVVKWMEGLRDGISTREVETSA